MICFISVILTFCDELKVCDFLVVGVTTDDLCFQRKHKYPIINEQQRMQIISAVRYVDKVVLQSDMDKLAAVERENADIVFVGSDWKGTQAWDEYEREFATVGCRVVYLKHTDGISSTLLRQKIEKNEF